MQCKRRYQACVKTLPDNSTGTRICSSSTGNFTKVFTTSSNLEFYGSDLSVLEIEDRIIRLVTEKLGLS